MKKILLLFAALAALFSSCSRNAAIENMKCEYLVSPICIDTPNPHFTWTYTSAVGSDFIPAGSNVEIAFEESLLGKENVSVLEPLTDYVWRVTVWNEDKSKTFTSPAASFRTAMFSGSDWKALWINDGASKEDQSVPMLRKEFTLRGGISYAYLYVSAAAYAHTFINGQDAYPATLEPGYTAYDRSNLYGVYDVKSLLKEGDNAVAAVLGNGFYNEINGLGTWSFEKASWRGRARYIAEIHVGYSDGSEDVIVTDPSWKTTTDGPYVRSAIYAGDTYDARREMPLWESAGFDDSAWNNAVEAAAPSPVLRAQKMPAIEPVERISPVDVRSWGDTLYVFDFGINTAGVCELNVQGEEGTRIAMRHGEIQNEDGSIVTVNIDCYYNPCELYPYHQYDVYYLKGGQKESWHPSFTYHGFRYVEVTLDRPMKLSKENLCAITEHTNVASAASFTSSNEIFNLLWTMGRRTYLNNLYSVFTDCPQREKNGWTADNFLTTEMGLLNFDVAPYFINKWTWDVVDNIREDGRISGIMPDWGWGYDDWIGPVWDSSIFSIAEYVYDYTGSIDHIRTLWPVYKRYLEYLQTREESDGLPTYGIGDWVYLNVATPTEFTTPCFYYKDYCVMARFAPMMGEDPAPYLAKAEKIRSAINAKWFNAQTNLYANGSQAAQGVALYLGIAPEGTEQAIADNLAASIRANNGYLEFGSMGSKTVPRVLTKYGHVQLAYDMASKEDSPCWGGWIKKGMTTFGETWVIRDDWKDASLDHAFLGDVIAWYVNDLAGINFDPLRPGFKHVVIRPHFPEGLDNVSASYDSAAGTITSSWKREGGSITLSVDIPYGSTSELVIDGKSSPLKAGKNVIKL